MPEAQDFTRPDDRDYNLDTAAKALDMLDGMGHMGISENLARQMAKRLADESIVRVIKFVDRRSEFKGFVISAEAAREGDFCYGVDPNELALDIARFHHVPVPQYFGRGTQLREAVRCIRQHFEAEHK